MCCRGVTVEHEASSLVWIITAVTRLNSRVREETLEAFTLGSVTEKVAERERVCSCPALGTLPPGAAKVGNLEEEAGRCPPWH